MGNVFSFTSGVKIKLSPPEARKDGDAAEATRDDAYVSASPAGSGSGSKPRRSARAQARNSDEWSMPGGEHDEKEDDAAARPGFFMRMVGGIASAAVRTRDAIGSLDPTQNPHARRREDDNENSGAGASTEAWDESSAAASSTAAPSGLGDGPHVVVTVVTSGKSIPTDVFDAKLRLFVGDYAALLGGRTPRGPVNTVSTSNASDRAVSNTLNYHNGADGSSHVVTAVVSFSVDALGDTVNPVPLRFSELHGRLCFFWAASVQNYNAAIRGGADTPINNVGVLVHFPNPELPYASLFLLQPGRAPLHNVSVRLTVGDDKPGTLYAFPLTRRERERAGLPPVDTEPAPPPRRAPRTRKPRSRKAKPDAGDAEGRDERPRATVEAAPPLRVKEESPK